MNPDQKQILLELADELRQAVEMNERGRALAALDILAAILQSSEGPRDKLLHRCDHLAADHYGVSINRLHERGRSERTCHPRQLATWLARFLKTPLDDLKLHFGQDRTSVLNSIRAVQNRIDTDTEFAGDVLKMSEQLKNQPSEPWKPSPK